MLKHPRRRGGVFAEAIEVGDVNVVGANAAEEVEVAKGETIGLAAKVTAAKRMAE